ncbi:MAG: hypothetical protein MK200_07655, partial [Nitrosopumilus sp.]|nr:hypothetical protein [Nitrosopumilus sp.]
MAARSIFEHMQCFLAKDHANPLTGDDAFIAKDKTYEFQESEEAYQLFIPLVTERHFMFIKTYIDSNTNLPKRVLSIAIIDDFEVDAHGVHHYTPPHVGSDRWKYLKGDRFVKKFVSYFGPEHEELHRARQNSNV